MIPVDIGFGFVAIFLSTAGSILHFWVARIKEELESANSVADKMAEIIKEAQPNLKDVNKSQRRKTLRRYIRTKRKSVRSKYKDTWLISLFFGIVAGILYLLVSDITTAFSFFFGAITTGYAGETFVLATLKEENQFEGVNAEDFRKYLAQSSQLTAEI